MTTNLIVPTTELEAVNYLLASIGESPVNTLESGFVDAELARDLLRQVSRQSQVAGWSFNTEYAYPLVPDGNGNINLPANTLKVISTGQRNIVARGSKLYDNTAHSYTFSDTVTADLVLALPFDELPEVLRAFITIRASRRFQSQLATDAAQAKFSEQDEFSAWTAFHQYETTVNQWNVVEQSQTIIRIKGVPR